MNDLPQDTVDDDEIRELLKPLREIDAPSGIDVKCWVATRNFSNPSNTIAQRNSNSNWHSRLVVFAAIAASLLMGVAMGWTARGQVAESVSLNATPPMDVADRSDGPSHIIHRFRPNELADATSTVDYQEGAGNPIFVTQEFYLCGAGRIQSKSEYLLKGE